MPARVTLTPIDPISYLEIRGQQLKITEVTTCSLALTRGRLVTLAALTLCVEIGLRAQVPDITKPPTVLKSAGAFSAVRLSRPPRIDGREWIPADVRAAYEPGTIPLPIRAFSLILRDCGDHCGDFERCQLLFQRGRAAPVRIDDGFTGWVFVTPDGRYIVTEPLYVLDVREWKQYALFEALQIPNYTDIRAISRDGKRLLIARRECAIDCRGEPYEYYQLTVP